MRHFSLQLGNETRGPLTEDEISAMIAEGALSADTLCLPEGATEWVPLSTHFKFGSTLKVRWSKPVSTEGEEEIAATRLDEDTRKRLLVYGLADAVSVDRFTQVQAMLAIADHEKQLRAQLDLHRYAGLAALGLAALGGVWLGLTAGPVADVLALLPRPVITERGDSRTRLSVLRSEIEQFALIKARAERAVFEKPKGGAPGLNLIASRLNIDPATAFAFRGQADTTPLARKTAVWGLTPDADRRIYVLRDRPTGRPAELLQAQVDVLDQVLSAPLDEAGFSQLFAEVMTGFPAATFTEAGLLRNDAAGMRMSALGIFIDRVDFRARAAASVSAQKQWSTELTAFSDRLKALQAKVHARTAPEARRRRWSEFNAGPGAELAAWVLTSGAKEAKINPDGTFTVNGVPSINATSLDQVIVTARLNGDTVYLRWGSPYLGAGDWRSETLPKTHFIERERYKVVDKTVVGGRTLYARFETSSHVFVKTRVSPRWHYLAIARATDKEPIFALVDEKAYAAAAKGAPLELTELAKADLYLKAEESARPDGLTNE
jgi:hypothetical protein